MDNAILIALAVFFIGMSGLIALVGIKTSVIEYLVEGFWEWSGNLSLKFLDIFVSMWEQIDWIFNAVRMLLNIEAQRLRRNRMARRKKFHFQPRAGR